MMPAGNLIRMVAKNTLRSPQHFILSAFGIVIGIATFVIFLASTEQVAAVLEKIFPVEQVQVVAPRASLLGKDISKKLDDAIVQKIKLRPEVKFEDPKKDKFAVVPRMNLAFPAFGRGDFEGNDLKFEVGGFADGIDPEFVTDDERIRTYFKDWDADTKDSNRVACVPPPKNEDEEVIQSPRAKPAPDAGQRPSGWGDAPSGSGSSAPADPWGSTGSGSSATPNGGAGGSPGGVTPNGSPGGGSSGGATPNGGAGGGSSGGATPNGGASSAGSSSAGSSSSGSSTASGSTTGAAGSGSAATKAAAAGTGSASGAKTAAGLPKIPTLPGFPGAGSGSGAGADPKKAKPPEYFNPCPNPDRYYCDDHDNTCHHRVPVVMSPTMIELYNGQFAKTHGLPIADTDFVKFVTQRGGLSAMRFSIGLGLTTIAGSNANISRKQVRRVEAVLVGISDKAMPIGMTMPIQYIQRWNREFLGEEAATTYSSIIVTLNDRNRLAVFAQWLQDDLDLRLEDSLGEKFATVVFIIRVILVSISLVIIVISAINIAHNFFMQVTERKRELGLLRAVGATRSDVLMVVLGEAALIGLIAGVLGVLLGVGLATVADWALGRYLPRFPYKPETWFHFKWWISASGLACAAGFAVFGGWLPARRASRMEPAQALTQN